MFSRFRKDKAISLFWNILIVIFFLDFYQTPAQRIGTVRGVVTDSTSGEALAYGNAVIEELNIGSSTDSKGYFIITSVPANKNYRLTVSYIGYQKKTIYIFIGENKITEVRFELVPKELQLETIEKIGEKVIEENATDLGLHRIALKDLEMLPKGVETDIFRSLQYLPGVSATGDFSAKYYVRGGSSDQNLVLLDGVTIYNPFHALGIFSVVDPEMINSAEFYKGGFPPEHGGRLSSILNIVTKEGNKFNFGGKASLSFLTAKALIEGPIPDGSFIVTGRKNYSSIMR